MSLQNDIESVVKSMDFELYDAVVVSENEETIYRISIISKSVKDSKREGVSLDSCVELTHLISPLLDVTPPVSGEYRLEVGTAGIERKLLHLSHFKKSIGERVSFLYSGKEKIKGVLASVNGSIITIQTDEDSVEIEFNDIVKAKTYFEW